MKRFLLITVLLSAAILQAPAQSRGAIDTSTDFTMFAPTVAGAVTVLVHGDREGFWQLIGSGAASVASAYALKYSIRKERPDGSDKHSFPSNHTGVAFMGATFIGKRYGWKYSIPAYLISGYTAWGRIYAKKHDIWDVIAGAAIGTGCALLITTPYAKNHKLTITPFTAGKMGTGIQAKLQF